MLAITYNDNEQSRSSSNISQIAELVSNDIVADTNQYESCIEA